VVDNKLLKNEISATGIKEFIKKALPDYEGGRRIYARDLQKIDGYMTPPLNIMIDYDWKEVFADRAGVSVSEKENVLTIPNAQPEDLQRILDLDRFSAFFYRFQLDGKEYMGYKFPKNELRKLIQQGLPRKQLVIGRMDCMECLLKNDR